MKCKECLHIFEAIGDAFNSPMSTVQLLEVVARTLTEQLYLKGCHFRLLSRDQRVLEHVAAYGLSERFLDKGPVDAERSVSEALKGKTVMVADCSTDPRIQYPVEFAEEGIVSLLTVPLQARGQVIGVMRLSTNERREFSEQELEILEVVASFCASAIIHSMFHDILEQVTGAIRTSLDLDQVLESIARSVTERLRCKGCTIRLYDPRKKRLEVHAAFGLSEEYLDRLKEQPGRLAFEALEGECVSILEARHDPKVLHADAAAREGISSMLYVPLMSRDKAVGVMCVYTNLPYEFSHDEIYLMQSIGEQCALAIRNAQMYAAIKRRYDSVVDEFQQWFEHYCVYPARPGSTT